MNIIPTVFPSRFFLFSMSVYVLFWNSFQLAVAQPDPFTEGECQSLLAERTLFYRDALPDRSVERGWSESERQNIAASRATTDVFELRFNIIWEQWKFLLEVSDDLRDFWDRPFTQRRLQIHHRFGDNLDTLRKAMSEAKDKSVVASAAKIRRNIEEQIEADGREIVRELIEYFPADRGVSFELYESALTNLSLQLELARYALVFSEAYEFLMSVPSRRELSENQRKVLALIWATKNRAQSDYQPTVDVGEMKRLGYRYLEQADAMLSGQVTIPLHLNPADPYGDELRGSLAIDRGMPEQPVKFMRRYLEFSSGLGLPLYRGLKLLAVGLRFHDELAQRQPLLR